MRFARPRAARMMCRSYRRASRCQGYLEMAAEQEPRNAQALGADGHFRVHTRTLVEHATGPQPSTSLPASAVRRIVCALDQLMADVGLRKLVGMTGFGAGPARAGTNRKTSARPHRPSASEGRCGRDDRIRTCDPLTPSQVRYQAALHPETVNADRSTPSPSPQAAARRRPQALARLRLAGADLPRADDVFSAGLRASARRADAARVGAVRAGAVAAGGAFNS